MSDPVLGEFPNDRPQTERLIVGALRDCIHAHGPITEAWLGSAAKRVIGALKTHRHNQERDRFWKSVRECAEEVSSWPKWKQAGVLAQKDEE